MCIRDRYFIPIYNIDSYEEILKEHSATGKWILNRKNMNRDFGGPDAVSTGVDLNRNFPYQF